MALVNTQVYGRAMSKRLSESDWIDAGLRVLASRGFHALKAEPLAKELGVSRGSFYWHFADVEAFHRRVIAHWKAMATEAVIAEIEDAQPLEMRLPALLRRALSADPALEIAMRSWAAAYDAAAAATKEVDRRRRAYLTQILTECGTGPALAGTRAAILYWTYLGCALTGTKPAGRQLGIVIEELCALGAGRISHELPQ